MKMVILVASALVIFLTFSGTLPKRTPDYKTFELAGFAQGTNYHITYYATDSTVNKKMVADLFSDIDSSLSLYKSYSLINKFNSSASGIEMDEHMARVVKRSLQIYKQSEGVFDVTIYPLVDAWGFGNRKVSTLPNPGALAALMNCIGSNKLQIKGNQLLKADPCTRIDVNGIAQGYSVDLIADLLEKKGIKNYLVELGGEIRVKGRKYPGNERMKIGIEQAPGNPVDESIRRIVQMSEGAITTSGNYRKYIQDGTKKLSHLINARTGYPLDNEVISVTVRAKDAMTADGYDNVLIAQGVKKGMSFLRKHKELKLEAYFIYLKEDGSIGDTASAGFFGREQRIKSKE